MSYHAGFVAILGRPNAGKSTLMNALLGEKISIVSSKPQTTRRRVSGIWSEDEFQVVFVDSPGMVKAEKGLNSFLQREVFEVLSAADAAILVVGHDEWEHSLLTDLFEALKRSTKKFFVLFNKADLPPSEFVVKFKQQLLADGHKYLEASALKDKAIGEKLKVEIVSMLPESEGPLYPDEDLTLENSRQIAAEFVREKCFEFLHQELPYSLAVRISKFDEEREDLLKIYADIIIEKENHKSMVIGSKGAMIKQIGQAARIDMEKLFDTKVYLELHVVVRPGWTEKDVFLRELGYDHRKEK